jgi:hypothetical protein
LGNFVFPFFVLLGRGIKQRPPRLALIAGWLLVMHYVDLYWVVMPELTGRVVWDWSSLSALVGVLGIASGYAVLLLRGRHAIPVGDPFLERSLAYRRML